MYIYTHFKLQGIKFIWQVVLNKIKVAHISNITQHP